MALSGHSFYEKEIKRNGLLRHAYHFYIIIYNNIQSLSLQSQTVSSAPYEFSARLGPSLHGFASAPTGTK